LLDPQLDAQYEFSPYDYHDPNKSLTHQLSSGSGGGVVFVNHTDDFIPVLLELVASDDSTHSLSGLRRKVEAQAYTHYDRVMSDISSLKEAMKSSQGYIYEGGGS